MPDNVEAKVPKLVGMTVVFKKKHFRTTSSFTTSTYDFCAKN